MHRILENILACIIIIAVDLTLVAVLSYPISYFEAMILEILPEFSNVATFLLDVWNMHPLIVVGLTIVWCVLSSVSNEFDSDFGGMR